MPARQGRWTPLVLASLLAACATRPPPITKIVGGKVIVTRSVSPAAYEHAARALMLEEQERWAEAAAELQRAVIYDPDAPELHARLAEAFMRLDRLEDAAASVRTSLSLGETAAGLMARAHLAQLRGDAPGALAALERARAVVSFDEDPAQAEEIALQLGDAALLALDAARARAVLEALCAQAPGSVAGRLRLAAVAWALGDLRAAERRLGEALREEPNQLDAWLHLAWLHAAQGRGAGVRAAFREALDRSEGAPEIAAAFARWLVATGAAAEAATLADDLPSADLRDAEAVAKRIDLERAAKRWDRALEIVRAAAADPPDELRERLPLIEAQLLADKGRKADAAALLARLTAGSAPAEVRVRAAELLRDLGRADEAARLLDQLGELEGDLGLELLVARALVDEKQGDAARAARRIQQALARRPGQARLTLLLAAIEDRRGQWRRALDLVEAVLKKDPGAVEALNFWGFVAVDHGHEPARAMRRLVSALALDPGSGAILDSVGWGHFRAGDLPRAALFLEQAGRLEPDDAEILSHLGELYARRAERDRAAAAFRKALAQEPGEPLRRRIEEALARLGAQKAARP